MIENLKKQPLISRRLIQDHMHAKEVGANDIVLTDKLRRSCLASSSKRKQILAEKKERKKKKKSYLKRKRRKKGLPKILEKFCNKLKQ